MEGEFATNDRPLHPPMDDCLEKFATSLSPARPTSDGGSTGAGESSYHRRVFRS